MGEEERMKVYLTLICAAVLMISFITAVPADANTRWWYWDNDSHGSYVPRRGYFYEWIPYSGMYSTQINFYWSQRNADAIWRYSKGYGAGGCRYLYAYPTLDMTSTPWYPWYPDSLSAYYIVSSVPNPVYDIDDDDGDRRYEESEVTAHSSRVTPWRYYYMYVQWRDYRDCQFYSAGRLQARFAESHRWCPWCEFNTCIQSDRDQIYNTYGACRWQTLVPTQIPDSPQYVGEEEMMMSEFPEVGLEKFKPKENAGTVRTTITFRNQIAVGEAELLIKDFEIKPRMAYLLESRNGQMILSAVIRQEDGFFLEGAQDAVNAAGGELLGVAALVGSIPESGLSSLQKDQRVYLADVPDDQNFEEDGSGNKAYAKPLSWEILGLSEIPGPEVSASLEVSAPITTPENIEQGDTIE